MPVGERMGSLQTGQVYSIMDVSFLENLFDQRIISTRRPDVAAGHANNRAIDTSISRPSSRAALIAQAPEEIRPDGQEIFVSVAPA
jgi:hypothetical protein